MSAPFKPMLCKDGKGRAFPSGEGWFIEPKLDGWRFLFHTTEDGVRSYAGRNGSDRTGQPPRIEEALAYLPPDTILDAELVVLGESSPKVSTVLAHPERGILHAVVFDILRINGNDVTRFPWFERRSLLDSAAAGFDGIEVTMSTAVAASEDGYEQHCEWLDRGYEGSVAKHRDSLYAPGQRSSHWIKFKPQETIDAVIVGLVPGEGKLTGFTGAFEVELLTTGERTTTQTHNDAQRLEVLEHPEWFIGKKVELRHHGELESGKVRHPVFSRMRPDLDTEGAAA